MNYDGSPPGSIEVKVTPTVNFFLELVDLNGTLVYTPTKIACQYAKDPDSIFVHTFSLSRIRVSNQFQVSKALKIASS